MFFGLTNALANFQHMMNDLFKNFLDDLMIIYLDDLDIIKEPKGAWKTCTSCFQQILEKKGCVLNWRNAFFIYQK